MGYYMAGDYYMSGDPGLFSFLGKAVKGVAKTAVGIGGAVLAASPVGQAVQAAGRTFTAATGAPVPVAPTMPMTFGALPTMPARVLGAGAGAAVGTVAAPFMKQAQPRVTKAGAVTTRKRPRMNPYNPRALARASRRIDSMRKSMSKALRHTNYKIVSKGAGRGRGSRGVITRSEAARALRG